MPSRDEAAKERGAFYTPEAVAVALVRWAARCETDRMIDPACGDGRFLACHPRSVGVERDVDAVAAARQRAPQAEVHQGDFFGWAQQTTERFDCAAGNPPFIRYQMFSGDVRKRALRFCADLGVFFSGLTASWAPFLVVTAGLLRPGGRMAFVVPAAVGHAPYAAPLIDYLIGHFDSVRVVAIRRKLFPRLSEDCWLLFVDGAGGSTAEIDFTSLESFRGADVPAGDSVSVPIEEWRRVWNRRLRPYLLSTRERSAYQAVAGRSDSLRLGIAASIGIGYVSGANEFFHLRPSEAVRWGIPEEFLHPTVRNSRVLPANELTSDAIDAWRKSDEPMLLLRIPKYAQLPPTVVRYLDCDKGLRARESYKCRTRDPWYSVPDVRVPAFFLTYMSGISPNLVRNSAAATCTNALHAVHVRDVTALARLSDHWNSPYVQLSCELEGHALGGGMLKLEPGEAARVVLPSAEAASELDGSAVGDAISTLRSWRHYAAAA